MTTTKDIRPSDHTYTPCDICGRTLLRGELVEVFVHAGHRRSVCELCKPRAIHEGWKREGAMLDYSASTTPTDRRRSLLGRLRRPPEDGQPSSPTLDDALSEDPFAQPSERPQRPSRRSSRERGRRERPGVELSAPADQAPAPSPRRNPLAEGGVDHRVLAALEHFNASQHTRTVAGVARSLGPPVINVLPDRAQPTLVWITVSWELCWYRYGVDLDLDGASVELDSQGYELSELSELQRLPGGEANEAGKLSAY
jgi:hypothetical protein